VADIVAGTATPRIVGKALTAPFKCAEIAVALLDAPGRHRVGGDAVEVGFGPGRKTKLCHGSARQRQAVLGTDALEDARLGVGARVALVDRGAELGHLRVVAPLLALERGDAGAHYVLDAADAAGGNLGLGETDNFVGQVDVAHVRSSFKIWEDYARKSDPDNPRKRPQRGPIGD
jgi:hypothetical protein